jgi:hypothetical protein
MARCGRCGIYNRYPNDYREKKWDGVCLWYQHRLLSDEVWEQRECEHFFETIPGLIPTEQLEYKVQRENLGSAYRTARHSRILAYVSLAISGAALLANLLF